jgi:large subunit ribosomal protein L25
MAIIQLKTEFRTDQGKGASRRLRRADKIPAVLYGGGRDPISLQFDHTPMLHTTANEKFYTSILELSVGDKTQKAILRDMQRHPYKKVIMHMDFQRISDTEKLRMKIPFHFVNQETSPAGKTSGVLILRELNDVEVLCLPKDLPEFIEIDLGALKLGDIVHLSDVKLPNDVEIPELALGKEHDVAVVVAKMSAAEQSEETAAEAAPAAAPAGKAPAKAAAPAKGAAAPAAKAPAAPAKKK